jgi:hypothetical protein
MNIRLKNLITKTATLTLIIALSACSKKSNSGSATAKLQFSDSTPAQPVFKMNMNHVEAVTSFKMKLIAAYIAEDIDSNQNNVGQTSMFYLNSQCNEDIMHCDTDPNANGGLAEDGNPWTGFITEMFDFSNVSTVNTALNSQGRSVVPATYKYVRLEFCKYPPSESAPNMSWTYDFDGSIFTLEKNQATCTITTPIPSGMTVNDGDTVIVNLGYDLASSIGGGNCDSGGNCFDVPDFYPTVSKE